ncbi:hypothetical protein LR48_Vigan05g075300 [Vigna angularis]|uniref:Carboxylesterase 15 n=2 Tax=Phaseolus angularis TaxID=3914 RepID=A0A0L9UKR0_PHAAN|nr:probable carboxylesterase 15 [Vigna angularis]KAG2372029.1 carboxylesterase 15 [Vigna angularis]KOM43149.1 hypothetical protein LR48_Vigan05g075300 [Vigna angularis]BAT92787.1 hypothetical protein VIGAN_07162400 [Vigna angularis var. angularis]
MVQQKNLVDEVSGWLRIYDDGSVDRTWTGPAQFKFMSDPVPSHEKFIDGIAVRDTIISREGHDLRVRLYLPEKALESKKKLPIILHFQGGGFCISEPDWFMYYQIYVRVALSTQAIVVSPFLRRAPEHRLPTAIDDAFDTLLWLQSVARSGSREPWLEQHGDFNRLFLIGDSSGGNVVHEVASRAGSVDLSPVRVAGAIPVHPGFVRSERSRSELKMPQSPFLTLDMLDKFLELALPVGATKDHPITCPMGEAAPALEGLKLPAVLLCVAEMDLVRDTEMEYYEAMKKANKDVELYVSHGMSHSFYLNKVAVDTDPNVSAKTDAFITKIKEFIQEH